MPLISVVIPLYNKEPYIKRAIDSVLSQKIEDFELIIVDDGSTDKSAEVVQSINDERIKLMQQENAGVSAARNRGIKEAKADLIAFLDADDEWLPDFLEISLELWQKYPNAGAYFTGYIQYINAGIETNTDIYGIPEKTQFGILHSYFESATKGLYPITSSNVLIPKKVFDKIGNFVVGKWWGEDSDMWGRIALKYSIAYNIKKCSIYHTEIQNRACTKVKVVEEHPFIKTANVAILNNEVPSEILSDLKEYIAKKQLQTASRNLQASRPDLARKNIKKCKTKNMKNEKYWILFWTYVPSNIFMLLKNWKSKTRKD
ncbi:MAG: glycosyltransferase family A protein [Methanolobus sp.]|nr:glycosyltransferase family A protein [Methanolobus sp.]